MNPINQQETEITHSGYVAIIGRPNVGKSTLLNTLLREKISITSPKPQTTRTRILGIKIYHHAQIIYIDTPGLHQNMKKAMNKYMNKMASTVIPEVDVILFMIDAQGFNAEDELVFKKLAHAQQPIILIINKIDLLKDKAQLLPLIEQLNQRFPFKYIIPLCAKSEESTLVLEKHIAELLPLGSLIYPEDQVTDKSLKFLVAEMIREKIIYATEEELPYATTVEIEQFEEADGLIKISAVIWVERAGQKVIVIGKGGTRLKKIGTEARRDIEKLVQNKVFLRLWVKVKTGWSNDDKALHNLGYD